MHQKHPPAKVALAGLFKAKELWHVSSKKRRMDIIRIFFKINFLFPSHGRYG